MSAPAPGTPLPWQLEGNWEAGRRLGGWLSTMHPSPLFEMTPLVGSGENIIANARYIVTACNAFPDLVDALESLLNSCGARGAYHALKYADAIDSAEAALTKAKGEQA